VLTAKIILAAAEKAFVQAEGVRLAAFKAFELAQEAVKLEAAGIAAELLIVALDVATKALRDAEIKALEAWEEAASRSFASSMTIEKLKR